MEDVLQKVWVEFEHADLQRLQRILTLGQAYRVACERLVEIEDAAMALAADLDKAVWPNTKKQPKKLEPAERIRELMQRYSTLPAFDGLFALETREKGFVDAWMLELEFKIQVESTDSRFAGTREMDLYNLHPERQKAVLCWTNEYDDDDEFYSFAIGVDLCQPERQEVTFAVCEGEFYGATDAIQGFILQDSGRVDA